jgi:RNA polymerase sigma-70 factor (ECF subfamily)
MKKSKDSLKDLGYKFKETRSEKVFNELYERIRPGLFNYIYQIMQNTDDTENLVSITMSNVYSKIDQYKVEWHISTWIYRIAYTTALNELRFRKKRKVTHMSDIENSENKNLLSKIEFESIESYKDNLIEAEEKKTEEENGIKILSSLEALPEQYSSVLKEKYFNDLKYDEIAEKLKIPLHTVKNRVARGKKLLEELYSQ